MRPLAAIDTSRQWALDISRQEAPAYPMPQVFPHQGFKLDLTEIATLRLGEDRLAHTTKAPRWLVGSQGSHARMIPLQVCQAASSSRAVAKAATALSRSAVVCPAEICTRMRALPCGTTG